MRDSKPSSDCQRHLRETSQQIQLENVSEPSLLLSFSRPALSDVLATVHLCVLAAEKDANKRRDNNSHASKNEIDNKCNKVSWRRAVQIRRPDIRSICDRVDRGNRCSAFRGRLVQTSGDP